MRIALTAVVALMLGAGAFACGPGTTCMAACESPTPSNVRTPAAATTTTPARSSSACLPAAQIPREIPIEAAGSDCVTAALRLSDAVVFGTEQGNLGVVRNGQVLRGYAINATGAVTNIEPLHGGLVMFVVDQGVGLFDARNGQQIRLAGRDLKEGYLPVADAQKRIANDYYFALYPEPLRPHTTAGGQLGAETSDGELEDIFLDPAYSPGESQVCATYGLGGDVPERDAVCVDTSDIVPPTTPAPAPTIPSSDPCLPSVPAATARVHALSLTISRDALTPASLTVTSGVAYTLTLTNDDPGVLHTFRVYDGQEQNLVRDINGTRMCAEFPAAGGSITVPIALAGPPRDLTFEDSGHAALRGTLHVVSP